MKDLLNPEGVFFQSLSRLGDLIILNFLFLVCCLPVVQLARRSSIGETQVSLIPMLPPSTPLLRTRSV